MKKTQEKWQRKFRRKIENLQSNKKEQGITLIALVVTIVVLLILGGITINMLFSNGGIFKTAQDAANAWNEATVNEQESLNNIADQIGNLVNGQTGGEDAPTVPPEWDLSIVIPVPSEDTPPVNVPVPKGFTPSTEEEEKTVEGGFVIKQDGTNNEFVWIPVDETGLNEIYTEVETPVALAGEIGVTTSIYSKLRYETSTTPGTTSGRREPDLVVGNGSEYDANSGHQTIVGASSTQEFAQDMVDEYQEIYDSIKQYGGFYIGRYELTGSISSPTVTKGGTVITNQNWYHLKAACMKLVDNTGKQESEIIAKTTMIYGNQWDEVCNWLSGAGYNIEDSTSWGNYNDNTEQGAGEKRTAGYKETWKANNIYDFAGNCFEWTQEANGSGHRVPRGGYYGGSGLGYRVISGFVSIPNYDKFSALSTRTILYIM